MQLDKLTIKSQEAWRRRSVLRTTTRIRRWIASICRWRCSDRLKASCRNCWRKSACRFAKLQPDVESELERRHRFRERAAAIYFSYQELKKALDAAQSEAGKLKDDYISTEHLLLGLLDGGGSALKQTKPTGWLTPC
jgi:ATP-dependent Clp protease ATP-binding subunit ClpB